MEPKQFDEIVERRLTVCRKILVEKSAQYTRNNDKLHNFRQTARRDGITMIEALHGMMAKHVQSYYDIKQDLIDGKEISQHTLDEKFTDLLNYHLLAEAIVVEHNEKLVGKNIPDSLADHIRNMNQRISEMSTAPKKEGTSWLEQHEAETREKWTSGSKGMITSNPSKAFTDPEAYIKGVDAGVPHRSVQDATEKFLAETKRINAEYRKALDLADHRLGVTPPSEQSHLSSGTQSNPDQLL